MNTLPDDADTHPVLAAVVYVVIQRGVIGVYSVFTSKEKLLETVNTMPGMEAWLDDNGHPQIKMIGSFQFNVIAIELDRWA